MNYERMTKAELISKLKALESSVEISKNKRLEFTPKELQEKYRTLFEALNDAIFKVDVETGLILDVNKQAEALLGIPVEEIVGMHYTRVHPVEEQEHTKKLFEKHAKVDKLISSEAIFVQHRDGRKIPVEISTSVFESGGKKVILGVLRDITECRWTAERNKTVIRTAFDGFWILDIQGRILEVNEAYCNLTGYGHEELLKLSVSDVEALEKSKDTKKHIQRVIETGFDRFESKHRCKDGRIIDIEVSVNYIDEKGGRLFAFIRDITERKRAEKELIAYQERLKSLASELSLVEERERHSIAVDLHDSIGQTLVYIKMKLEMLRGTKSYSDLECVLDEIGGLLKNTIHSIRSSIFDLSPPALYTLGFMSAVKGLIRQFQNRHGIVIDFVTDKHTKPLDDSIRSLLFKSIRELFFNIVKHANAHNVKLSIRSEDNCIRVKIKDDGIGFNSHDIIIPSMDKTGGFGLFSIQNRLEYLGGRLQIKSKPGCGTEVILVAPLKSEKKGNIGME